MNEMNRDQLAFNNRLSDLLKDIEVAKEDLRLSAGIKYKISQLMADADLIMEAPEEFYYRTTQLKNPGVLLLQEPSTYVSRHLQLPDYIKQINVVS